MCLEIVNKTYSQTVSCNCKSTVLLSNFGADNHDSRNFGKAVWRTFAKAKEKQSHAKSQRTFASHLLLPHAQILFFIAA